MRVYSSAKVARLNADKVDGLSSEAFLPSLAGEASTVVTRACMPPLLPPASEAG